MSFGEEQPECPLCMESFEPDDLSFFPCTCGYQICRFCWHRLRTEENGSNGLCPACRKQYAEDPAEFKPLSEDEVHRIRKERRLQDSQRKHKAAESRKHLANVRVMQHNLVFVVGLPPRLADSEILRKQEYFGKFGKIHKVVINPSTNYSTTQGKVKDKGPSVSAYVTFMKSEDALKAIRNVNNIHVDGRTLKVSLGTTKYCSHFLKGAACTKTDCMYLHELGDESASFTKEEMQQGKHLEYEQKLFEFYTLNKRKFPECCTQEEKTEQLTNNVPEENINRLKKHLNTNGRIKNDVGYVNGTHNGMGKSHSTLEVLGHDNAISRLSPNSSNSPYSSFSSSSSPSEISSKSEVSSTTKTGHSSNSTTEHKVVPSAIREVQNPLPNHWNRERELLPNNHDDDLGFDPWAESAKGLADLVQRETIRKNAAGVNQNLPSLEQRMELRKPPMYPWATNGVGIGNGALSYPLMENGLCRNNLFQNIQRPFPLKEDEVEERENDELLNACMNLNTQETSNFQPNTQSTRELQEGFRALLPAGVNIRFGNSDNVKNQSNGRHLWYDHVFQQTFNDPAIVSAGISLNGHYNNNMVNFDRMPPPGFSSPNVIEQN